MNTKVEPTVSQNVARNVKYYCQKNGIPIGTLEKDINVSAGYFSRYIGGTMKNMSIEIAVNTSKYLGISLDDMCTIKEDNNR